ncbi:MAG: winged helix-turn-helix transcriptional regulator, partial [bacterium]
PRLKEMQREKLILKRIVQTSPVLIHYELKEKGYAVLPILRGMARWSFVWAPERVFKDGKPPREIQACLDRWQKSLVRVNFEPRRAAPTPVAAAPRPRPRAA